ncbi:purine-cytosine permease family protein [Peterkaempfera bronchialis]|uniref:Cytosine or purine or uracil or thiamine or allantoin permease n=1 Tax=Peterkaempfera bronchialis TaxID=2126346 RepID=A0A345T149_9ACTN|nr:cytosine permease [Peterkaempfera bronchialis]AXI79704.1 cytosine or purine or uracil or thiamine or allantoin permease [Peterkaempfera bronchialis]
MTTTRTEEAAGFGTGVANDEVFRIETHGIDPIPDEDRHGSAKDLFWLWFGSNLTFTFVINGALAVAFGLSFWAATAAVVLGGLAFFAVSAAGLSGIRTGTATLVISRAAFGVLGNFPAGLVNWIVSIGYTVVNTVVGVLALQSLFGQLGWDGGNLSRLVALVATLAMTFVVAVWGHATVQAAEKWMAYALAVGFGLLIVLLLPGRGLHAAPAATGLNSFSAWTLALVVTVSGPVSYLPMPADYTRYLPRTTTLRSITWSGALGGLLSSVALGIAGVAAATRVDMSDPVEGVKRLLPGWFQVVFLLLVLGGSITNSILTLYSSSLNLQVLGIPWSRAKSIYISITVTTLGALGALFLVDFTTSLLSFLSLMVIVFAPWGGVFIADMLIRRCTYDTTGLHAGRDGAYWYRGGFHLAGMAALGIGMVFSALTADSELWTGPLVAPLGGGDLSLLGSVVSGLAYWALTRRPR